MTSNLEKVREFHRAFGVEENVPFTDSLCKFRDSLIWEEYQEVFEELYPDGEDEEVSTTNLDKTKLTKELCDLLYVVYGTGVTFGLPLDEAFDLVHKSNMSKLTEDGQVLLREDGKVLKGPNYKEADLSVLFE